VDTDVLIAGAGPTGLTAAAVLTRAGVRVRIVDPIAERSPHTRALVVHARTLELFQKLGIADELVSAGNAALRINLVVDGALRADVSLKDIGVDDSPYPMALFVSQAETERLLEGCAGVRVERETEFAGLVEHGDEHVTALLRRRNGDEERVRARYLLGADGAHSKVRKAVGLRFEGERYPQDFMLADVKIAWDTPHDRLVLFLPKKGLCVAFPLKGDGRYRLIMTAGPSVSDEEPTLEQAEALARTHTGRALTLSEPRWLSRFRLHHRGVDHYRAPEYPRVFVAGDAAHIHSPVGGQGMNTGIQDSFNLAWKLAAAIAGVAGDQLLHSYEAERLPVGRNLLRVTDRLFGLVTNPNPALSALRRTLLPRVVPWAMSDRQRRTKAFRFASQLQIKYRESHAVEEHAPDADLRFRAAPGPGHRAPDAPLDSGGTTLFRQMTSLRHHLLVIGSDARLEAAARDLASRSRWPLGLLFVRDAGAGDDVFVDTDGRVRERYGVTKSACYLVRPDGYIGYRGTLGNFAPLERYLTRLSG
jgi:2-polyprenyl-6-methoxyphenol hydroxylase-like FAD-dependent oxidoreductase